MGPTLKGRRRNCSRSKIADALARSGEGVSALLIDPPQTRMSRAAGKKLRVPENHVPNLLLSCSDNVSLSDP